MTLERKLRPAAASEPARDRKIATDSATVPAYRRVIKLRTMSV
jgi:hypothetical protein